MLLSIAIVALLLCRIRELLKISTQGLVVSLFLLRVFQVLPAKVEDGIAGLATHLVKLRLDVLLSDVDLAISVLLIEPYATFGKSLPTLGGVAQELSDCVVHHTWDILVVIVGRAARNDLVALLEDDLDLLVD